MKYEAHITIEPAPDEVGMPTFADFAITALEDGWRASRFDRDDVDGYAAKWFITKGSDDHDKIVDEVKGYVHGIECSGLTVLRWKIEETLYDSKLGDRLDDIKDRGRA